LKIDISKLIKTSLELLPAGKKDVADEIEEFFTQRLIIFLSDKYSKNVLEACAKTALQDLNDYINRVKAISKLNSEAVLESANRVLRILKEDSTKQINSSLFKEPAENMLLKQIETVSEELDYDAYLKQLIEINPSVEKFFNDVLVMDKDENVKENRLALLTLLKSKYNHLADFSKL